VNLAPLRDAVVTTLQPLFPNLRSVRAHGGTFNERELAILLGDAPCLLIAILRMQAVQPRGRNGWQADLNWGGFFLSADTLGGDRATAALDGVDTLLRTLVQGAQWGVSCLPPQFETILADNLYNGHVNNLSVALWAVAWTQTHHFEGTLP
jgi:phage gp37-like protein